MRTPRIRRFSGRRPGTSPATCPAKGARLMRRLITASLMALTVVGVFGGVAASAQQQLAFSIGGFSPRSEDARSTADVLNNNLDFLAFNISDFSGPIVGGEWI